MLAYLWVDRSISLSYARHDAESAIASLRGLELLLLDDWRGMSESQVLQRLQDSAARRPETRVVVKKDADAIWFDEICFKFKEGRLDHIGD